MYKAILGAGALATLMTFSGAAFDVAIGAEGVRSDLVNRRVLRVCADPANLPFSGKDEPGVENKIADIVAGELGITTQYTWFPQATGFIRKTLYAKRCDVVMGYAQGDEMVLNTNAYYKSAYALVYKKGSGLDGVDTLSDPKLKDKKIGIVAGSPPATVINRLGLMTNAKPYQLMVDRRYDDPSQLMINDIASGDVDVGVMWGPIAGYYAKKADADLTVQPLLKEGRQPRMTFRITMGVRPADTDWKRKLNEIIAKRQKDIDQVLLDYGFPIVSEQDQVITEPRT